MTPTEASHTLRYLFQPLATHVHILLISCLLLALGLGTLQNSSPDQIVQQANQALSKTKHSTSPMHLPKHGDSNTDVPYPRNSSSGSYEAQDQLQHNAYASFNSTDPLAGIQGGSADQNTTAEPVYNGFRYRVR